MGTAGGNPNHDPSWGRSEINRAIRHLCFPAKTRHVTQQCVWPACTPYVLGHAPDKATDGLPRRTPRPGSGYQSLLTRRRGCIREQSEAFYGRVTTAKARGCRRRTGGWGATSSPSKLVFKITTSFLKSAFQIRACPLSFNASFCGVINLRIRHTSFFPFKIRPRAGGSSGEDLRAFRRVKH